MGDIYSEIGLRVRRERKRLGWTQEELGEKTGMHSAYIGQIERGTKKISLAALQRLAQSLGLRIGRLLDELLPPSSCADEWNSKIDGLLRDKSPQEQDLLYSTLRHLSKSMHKKKK
ncbi:MAG: helix-turn-helix domain-containing protein [Elusimicrobiota bacterium]|jgi:transcriptional regulator with XRE-family HTH domain